MKRYLVFAGAFYYPGGGWDDFAGSADTFDEAKAIADDAAPDNGHCWSHVIDSTNGEVVFGEVSK